MLWELSNVGNGGSRRPSSAALDYRLGFERTRLVGEAEAVLPQGSYCLMANVMVRRSELVMVNWEPLMVKPFASTSRSMYRDSCMNNSRLGQPASVQRSSSMVKDAPEALYFPS